MKESPTETETATGSNPAGVAAQTTPEEIGNPDRTELRSVATPEDPPAPRRLEVTDGTFLCDGCGEVIGPTDAGPVSCVDCEIDDRGIFPLHQKAECCDKHEAKRGCGCGGVGKLPEPAADHGNPVLAADQFNAKPRQHCSVEGCTLWPLCSHPTANLQDALPEVRHCTATEGDGDVCGAIVGKDLHCGICDGQRCYQHCTSLDHFKGHVLSRGGAGSLSWKVVEIASGRFAGQLERGRELLAVVGLDRRLEHGAVLAEIEHRVKVLEATEAVTPEHDRARRASGREVHAGLFDALAATQGRIPAAKRVELVREVIEWLRHCENEWDDLECRSWDTIDALLSESRRLHNAQVLGLFSRLAGAL